MWQAARCAITPKNVSVTHAIVWLCFAEPPPNEEGLPRLQTLHRLVRSSRPPPLNTTSVYNSVHRVLTLNVRVCFAVIALQVVCPVARSLATQQPIMLHFASSGDIPRLMPEAGGRMQPPADLCQGQNITWAARIGKIGYGGMCSSATHTNTFCRSTCSVTAVQYMVLKG